MERDHKTDHGNDGGGTDMDGTTTAACDPDGEPQAGAAWDLVEDYLEGNESVLAAERQKTTDNTDGTVTLCLRVTAGDVPRDFATSPDGSLWRLTLPDAAGGVAKANAVRMAMRDAASGKVDLRLQVMAHELPGRLLWGAARTQCTATLRMLAGRHPYPHFVERGERAACLRRAVMFCDEPGFDEWAAAQAESQGVPEAALPDIDEAIGIDPPTARRLRATEHMCRLARIHSRREVLTSNVAAERVETLLRAYREHLWAQGGPARSEAARVRGLDAGRANR